MSAGPSVPGATDALKRFELENNISEIDQIYSFDNAEQQPALLAKDYEDDIKRWRWPNVPSALREPAGRPQGLGPLLHNPERPRAEAGRGLTRFGSSPR